MSLIPTAEITLKPGLTTEEFNKTVEDIKKVPGIADAFSASSKPDTIYSNYLGNPETLKEVRKIPNVVKVQNAPHRF